MLPEQKNNFTPELESWNRVLESRKWTGNQAVDEAARHGLLAVWLDNEGHENLAFDEALVSAELRSQLSKCDRVKVDGILWPKKK